MCIKFLKALLINYMPQKCIKNYLHNYFMFVLGIGKLIDKACKQTHTQTTTVNKDSKWRSYHRTR